MAVIGPAVAVFTDGPAEFGHREHDDVAHAIAQIPVERGKRQPQLAESSGELAVARTLVHVRVPAAAVREGDLQPHVRLDELRDLQQRLA